MKPIIHLVRSLSLALSLALTGTGPTQAQAILRSAPPDQPSVQLTPAQAGRFQTALDALAKQGHVALVAEGVPLRARLPEREARSLSAPMALETAARKIGAAYDYDVQRQNGVFVLKKRYTDEHDLPSVTLEEGVLALGDVGRVMDAFSPHVPTSSRIDTPDTLAQDVVNALSPEQELAMQNKTLHYGDLTTAQQALIQRLFLYGYVQIPSGQVQRTLDEMQQAPQTVLTTSDGRGRHGLYIEIVFDQQRVPVSLTQSLMAGANPVEPTPVPDVPRPDASDPPPATLGQVVAGLNRAGPSQAPGPPLEVDAALQAKTVTVAGLDNAPTIEALRALAAVYGLRIGSSEKGAPKLSRRAATIPTDLRKLSDSVWWAFPEPFQRAVRVGENIPLQTPPPALGGPADWKLQAQQDQENTRRRWRNMGLPAALRREAARRLLLTLQPKFKAAGPDARIPVASLSESARGLLALALISEALGALANQYAEQYNRQVVESLDYFDQVVISGKPFTDSNRPGRVFHSVLLRLRHPVTGQTVGLGGVGSD